MASQSLWLYSIGSKVQPSRGRFSRLLSNISILQCFNISSKSEKKSFSSSSIDNVRMEKQRIRKCIRAAMKGLDDNDINEQSKAVWERVIKLPIYLSSIPIGLFLSIPSGEINSDPSIQHCVESGKVYKLALFLFCFVLFNRKFRAKVSLISPFFFVEITKWVYK